MPGSYITLDQDHLLTDPFLMTFSKHSFGGCTIEASLNVNKCKHTNK